MSIPELNHSWARMRWFTLIAVIFWGGCGRLGIDELPHSKPTQAELSVAEANWEELERAFLAKDFNSARSLAGRPLVFRAQFHSSNTGPFAFALRYMIVSTAEEGKQLSKLSPKEKSERIRERFASLPRIPCRWKLTPKQERTFGHAPFLDFNVYGSLRAVGNKGIEVDPQDVETMSGFNSTPW